MIDRHRGQHKKGLAKNAVQVPFLFAFILVSLFGSLLSCGPNPSSPVSAAGAPPVPAPPPPPDSTPPPARPDPPSVSGQIISSETPSGVEDKIPPKVVLTIPKDGETFVRKNAVTVFFSEPIDPATLNGDSFRISMDGVEIAGKIVMTMAIGDPRGVAAATFTPSRDLISFKDYHATVNVNAKDLAGNPILSDHAWDFRTGIVEDRLSPPTILSVSPAPQALDVPINASIQVAFSEIMDPASITSGSFFVTQGLQRQRGILFFEVDPAISGTVVTFIFLEPLQLNATYSITVTRAVKEGAGHPMQSEYTALFTTTPSASSDGRTFSQPLKLSEEFGFSRVEIDDVGRIYAFSNGTGGIELRRSIDGGATFGPRQNIVPDRALEGVSIKNQTIDVVSISAEVSYSLSTDAGEHFSSPSIIAASDGFQKGGGSIARSNNLVGIVWADYIIPVVRAGFSGVFKPVIKFRRSLDGGNTFSSPFVLSGVEATEGSPKIAMSDSQDIYISWHDQFGDIVFSRSGNAGETFSPPINLTNNPTRRFEQSTQLLVKGDGTIDLVWLEGEGSVSAYLARSTDGGASFSAPSQLSFPPQSFSCSSLRVDRSGRFSVGWRVPVAFSNSFKSFFAISNDGVAFTEPAQIPVMPLFAGCPMVIIDPVQPQEIHLFWGAYYSKGTPTP